jgi:hypothetical protein
MSKRNRILWATVMILTFGFLIFGVAANSWKRSTKQPNVREAARKKLDQNRPAYLRRSSLRPKTRVGTA